MGYAAVLLGRWRELVEVWDGWFAGVACCDDDYAAVESCCVCYECEEAIVEILGLCFECDVKHPCLVNKVPELVPINDSITMVLEKLRGRSKVVNLIASVDS